MIRIRLGVLLIAVFVITSARAYGAADDVIARAMRQFRRDMLVESAGIFWIVAELAILFCMSVAARIFGERPLPSTLRLTAQERRWALLLAGLVLLLAAFVYGRHLVIAPLPHALELIGSSGADAFGRARNAYLARAHIHAALWCTLIVTWVVLEAAIVAQGIRAFHRLRELSRGFRNAT